MCMYHRKQIKSVVSALLLTMFSELQKLKAIEQLKDQAAAGKQLEKNQV